MNQPTVASDSRTRRGALFGIALALAVVLTGVTARSATAAVRVGSGYYQASVRCGTNYASIDHSLVVDISRTGASIPTAMRFYLQDAYGHGFWTGFSLPPLFDGSSGSYAPFTFNPDVDGWYRVFVQYWTTNAAGIAAPFAGEWIKSTTTYNGGYMNRTTRTDGWCYVH